MYIHKLSISIVLFTALIGSSIACSKRSSDDTIAKDVRTRLPLILIQRTHRST